MVLLRMERKWDDRSTDLNIKKLSIIIAGKVEYSPGDNDERNRAQEKPGLFIFQLVHEFFPAQFFTILFWRFAFAPNDATFGDVEVALVFAIIIFDGDFYTCGADVLIYGEAFDVQFHFESPVLLNKSYTNHLDCTRTLEKLFAQINTR